MVRMDFIAPVVVVAVAAAVAAAAALVVCNVAVGLAAVDGGGGAGAGGVIAVFDLPGRSMTSWCEWRCSPAGCRAGAAVAGEVVCRLVVQSGCMVVPVGVDAAAADGVADESSSVAANLAAMRIVPAAQV